MGDWSSTIECGRLEELATLAKSLKEPLLRIGEGNIGWLNLRVEGHEYLVTRCSRTGVRVCRMDLDDLTPAARFRQAITEFFSHQVFDFFRLRGVGTRSRRIARMVENWTRFPDGTEHTEGPPLLQDPGYSLTSLTNSITRSVGDYVRQHLGNHCTQQARSIPLPNKSAPLNDSDRQARSRIAQLPFSTAPKSCPKIAAELDDAACETVLRTAFASVPSAPHSSAGLQLNTALQSIARRASGMSDAATGSPMVAWARLLLLGHALSTKLSIDSRPIQRSAEEALATLEVLVTDGVFHQPGGPEGTPRECWHAARRLARCEIGFRLLCEFAVVPPGLAQGAGPQWHAALRIYLQAADHLIGVTAPGIQDRIPGSQANPGDAAALDAWTGQPVEAARYAATRLTDPSHPRANRLAYRALLAAVKLMQVPVLADTAWLKHQRQMAAARGIGAAPSLDAPMDKDEIVALCLWRNGFRDDLDDGLLAQFQRMLNRLVLEDLPHEERDPATGDVRLHIPDDSPVMLALGDPITQAATRRTLIEQSEDHQAAIGRMTRLLVLQIKLSVGLPLSEHEALLGEALALREALGRLALGPEEVTKLDAEFEQVVTRLDNAMRINELTNCAQSFSAIDSERLAHRLRVGPNARSFLRALRQYLGQIRARHSVSLDETVVQPRERVLLQESFAESRIILAAVRCSLLANWLACTELGLRVRSYPVTDLMRNAVVSDLGDALHISANRQAAKAELDRIPEIDLDLLDQWAREAGLIDGMETLRPELESSPAVRHEAARRFQRHRNIVSMLRAGRDKTDAGVILPDTPRSREDIRKIAKHRFDGSLGTGSRASVTRAGGMRAAVSIDTGPAQVLVPGAPSIGFSFSHEDTLSRTRGFSLIGSSVGGQTLSVSETVGERSQWGVGVSVNGPAALSIGIDGSLTQSGAVERGIALRTPPAAGSRKWVQAGQQSIDVIFGPRLERKLAKDRRQESAAPKSDRALRELCFQCFDALLSGSLALNVFDNQTTTETLAAGISVGGSTGVLADTLAKVSASGRLSKERDRLGPQSRVDRTGSTRLEMHSVGSATRYNAALQVLASLLPTKLSQHFKTNLSPGTAFGVSATFCERGVQHFLRRETRDGLTQPSFAWDIVYRDVDEFIAHMKSPDIRKQWDAFNASQDKDDKWALDERLQQVLLHARHSNQTYMVRRHLKPEKLGELNAMTALMDGLNCATAPFDEIIGRHGLPERCLSLLDADSSYVLGGFGAYTGDYHESRSGINGSGIFTETRMVSAATELLWFSARPAAPTPKAIEETGEWSWPDSPTNLDKPAT